MTYRRTLCLSALALLAAGPAAADWRCDCTTIKGSCNAQVTVQKNSIDVSSDSKQCSRVDYFIDGLPFVAVVTDGKLRQDWISRSAQPKVLIQSCQVCLDKAQETSATAPPAAANAAGGGASEGAEASSGTLQPLIRVEPEYPARAHGQSGFVELAFDVDEHGMVENARVTRAQPKGVFDAAALAALKRWRYPAQSGRQPVSLTTRIDFRPANAAPPQAAASTAGPPGPRNECIHQDTAYDFGDMVEVGLINACGQPLIVYACAQGTGTYLNHWVCTDSEQQQQVLVSQTDKRIGSKTRIDSPSGPADYRYTDNFFLTRAPNTQYWWLACGVSDSDCRNSARGWARSVDKQPASLDPQGRSSLTVARSL
jgi:TonB family protein